MSRAALLPTPGDPFLLKYYLTLFSRVWVDEIDKLYIYLGTTVEDEVVDYIKKLCAVTPKVHLTYDKNQQEHGNAINKLLDMCTEDYIVLMEDDAYVFKPGIVDECFRDIESGQFDVVGSKRMSCSSEIADRAAEVYGLNYAGIGDNGPNLWPCYLFTKADTLRATDRHFTATGWKAGEEIPYLKGYIAKEECAGDTFVQTSLNLRHMGVRFRYRPQYHGSPNDVEDWQKRINLWDGLCPWVHIGSLSSGISGVLRDGNNRQLAARLFAEPTPQDYYAKLCTTPQEQKEWERRVQWWDMFWEESDPNQIQEFRQLYKEAIERVIDEYKLSRGAIRMRKIAYRRLGL